jgi:hypothetical protein
LNLKRRFGFRSCPLAVADLDLDGFQRTDVTITGGGGEGGGGVGRLTLVVAWT